MKHPIFHVGERCYIDISKTAPRYSHLECEVTGPLMNRPVYDHNGQLLGYSMAYRLKPDEHIEEVCAPELMLRKKWERSDWGMLRGIWQPKRAAR